MTVILHREAPSAQPWLLCFKVHQKHPTNNGSSAIMLAAQARAHCWLLDFITTQ
jgi:hypothetical protein